MFIFSREHIALEYNRIAGNEDCGARTLRTGGTTALTIIIPVHCAYSVIKHAYVIAGHYRSVCGGLIIFKYDDLQSIW